MIRIQQHHFFAVGDKGEGGLVAGDALVCKVLEDLLESRLADAVLLNSQAALLVFELAEKPPDRLVLPRHAQLEKLSAVLQNFDFFEVPGQELDYSEADLLCLQELNEVAKTNQMLVFELRLKDYVGAKSILLYLLKDQFVELCIGQLLDSKL